MTSREPETCVCTAIRQAARRVTQHYDAALSATGISTNQYAILRRLQRFGASTVQALAARLVMDRSTLGHLLRPLEARGLVTLGTATEDRRRRLIALTAAGETVLAEAGACWQIAQDAFAAAYGPDETRQLTATLRHVCETTPGVGAATPD